jgi:porin
MVHAPGRRTACALLALVASSPASAAEAEGNTAPWRLEVVVKGDALALDSPRDDTGVGLANLRLFLDAGRIFGWTDTQIRLETLATEGGKPNRRLGTLQGISNLEVARNSVRIYGASIEHHLGGDSSVLFGLYDLNSDFYSTEASGLLIHPAFGIGAELAQTGLNGPSIFPNLGLALRGRAGLGGGLYAQAAVLDAVPGETSDSGRTWVHLSTREGTLLVGEVGWHDATADGDDGPAAPARWGIGVWSYSREFPRLDGSGRGRDSGAYVLGQLPLVPAPHGRTTVFARAGIANSALNPIETAFDAGVLVERPWGDTGPAALTAGVASAAPGATYRRLLEARGERAARRETTFEVGVRWLVGAPQVVVQPLLQHVLAAGARTGRNATIVGLRLEWSAALPTAR